MRFSNMRIQKFPPRFTAFTLIELLIVIALMAVLFQISITVFFSITKHQSLDKDVETAYSYLLKARNQTINGEAGRNYGVRFASTSITLFQGTTYSSASTTAVYDFANKSYLDSIELSGGTYDVYFQKITGSPSATGTLIFKISSDSIIQKSMTIHGSGLVEVQ
jgi:prepilin-type N-terminal cleavage/methylation domain-containing protein